MTKNDFQLAKVHAKLTPGEALKMLRELQGLSQVELAELTGINQSNISALENKARQREENEQVFWPKLKSAPCCYSISGF